MANRYQHVADELRRLIDAGVWPVGERLPPESELAERFRVSTPTLRNALEVLQSEGLVEKRHGSGNFVRRPEPRLRYLTGSWSTHAPAGNTAVVVHCETAVAAADSRLSALLNVTVGSPLTEYIFVSHSGAWPRTLVRVYVPETAGQLGSPTDGLSPWGDSVRHRLAADDIHVVATTEQITARFPTADEAHALHITSRTPVLALERLGYDANQCVVEVALLVLPGDRSEVLVTTDSPIKKLETTG